MLNSNLKDYRNRVFLSFDSTNFNIMICPVTICTNVSGQNDIWVLASWSGTKNTIRGKVVTSPKSRLW